MVFGGAKAARDAEFTAFVQEATPRLIRLGVGLTGSGEAYAYTRRLAATAALAVAVVASATRG